MLNLFWKADAESWFHILVSERELIVFCCHTGNAHFPSPDWSRGNHSTVRPSGGPEREVGPDLGEANRLRQNWNPWLGK